MTRSLITPSGIIAPSKGQVVDAGGNASFTVTAAGTAPLSYPWRETFMD